MFPLSEPCTGTSPGSRMVDGFIGFSDPFSRTGRLSDFTLTASPMLKVGAASVRYEEGTYGVRQITLSYPSFTRPAASAQDTPIDTQNVSESDPSVAPSPLPTRLSLDFVLPEPGTDRERMGAKSSKDSLSSIERHRRQPGRISLAFLPLACLVAASISAVSGQRMNSCQENRYACPNIVSM
jgi:hypothetical protein